MRRVLLAAACLLASAVAPVIVAAPARADNGNYAPATHADFVSSDSPDHGHYDRVGPRGVPVGTHSGAVSRGLWTFALPALEPGSRILAAQLNMHTESPGGCRQAPFDAYALLHDFDPRATWNSQPHTFAPVASTLVPYNPGRCAQGYFGFDVTNTIATAYQAGLRTVSFELRAQDETDPTAFKFLSTQANAVFQYDAPPSTPTITQVNYQSCASMPTLATGSSLTATVEVDDPNEQTDRLRLQLFTADHRTLIAASSRDVYPGRPGFVSLTLPRPLVDLHTYALRATAADRHLHSAPSPWCTFRVDNRIPETPTQSTDDFGTTSVKGMEGTPGTVTIAGGGPATVRYEWAVFNNFPVDLTCGYASAQYGAVCTNRGAAVIFQFTPTSQFFTLCVRAVSAAGNVSGSSCQNYIVDVPPIPAPAHQWDPAGLDPNATTIADTGAGTPTDLQLTGTTPTSDGRLAFDPAASASAPALISFARPWSILIDVYSAVAGPQTVMRTGPLTVQLTDYGLQACINGLCGTDGIFVQGAPNQFVLTWNPAQGVLSLYTAGRPFAYGSVPATITDPGSGALVFAGDPDAGFTGSLGRQQVFDVALTAEQVSRIGDHG